MDEILRKLLDSLKQAAETESVIGKPITNGDGTVILPVSKISYGFVSGGGEYSETAPKNKSDFPRAEAGGGGVTVTPLGFLICGRDKKFISVDKTTENKWVSLVEASINALKKEDD